MHSVKVSNLLQNYCASEQQCNIRTIYVIKTKLWHIKYLSALFTNVKRAETSYDNSYIHIVLCTYTSASARVLESGAR